MKNENMRYMMMKYMIMKYVMMIVLRIAIRYYCILPFGQDLPLLEKPILILR